MTVHILKLCVGADSVQDLLDWHLAHPSPYPTGERRHVTRMWPKREAEVLEGGSLFWVVKGVIQCRQRIIRFDEVDRGDGIRRCGIVMEPHVIRTEPAPRRPFQGWRYLKPEEAPRDLKASRRGEDTLPPGMAEALAEFGVR